MPEFSIHPSKRLVELFNRKPYQGANPETASILILGNDANYSEEISSHPFFESILEYHEDGVSFWQKYGVHHPFLLSDYPFNKTAGGVPYHRKVSKLGFNPDFAVKVSFVELLDVPTIGNATQNMKTFYELLNPDHLRWLESLIYSDQYKFVLINRTLIKEVSKISRFHGVLTKLNSDIQRSSQEILVDEDNLTLYKGYSFSASQCSNNYLENLSVLIKSKLEYHRA